MYKTNRINVVLQNGTVGFMELKSMTIFVFAPLDAFGFKI